ncbi:class I SAM-dependent methyltransferase [Rhizobium sp. SL42]|uniref:class I SAM-dependent methyltransferase n=1 Tax=Rhizobium sp. SL42 TaxID=2806346 RepID=UPI001F2C5AB2|nr:class I SAM-dependent methyltransferase [Rhizobium sp. SL42]UJW74433.1 class I SAM-dependent methyltransferase [Rhizobium sp. SL42]
MQRILEPEIMADPEQSLAYANADFSISNQSFVDHVLSNGGHRLQHVVDIGCGPCDVMVRLADACPEICITAIDGSAAMVELARRAVLAADHQSRIRLMQGYVPGLALPEHSFDAVLSKDLLHHLPDPMVLWTETQRLGRQGASVHVMDLIRPDTQQHARDIVEKVAPDAHAILCEDFYNSLCAAFTIDEINGQLEKAGLQLQVRQISDRHMLIFGTLP